jgi:2-isopropylmalate synthase
LKHRLQELGYMLNKDELEQVYQQFLVVADKKKEVFDEDLAVLIGHEIRSVANTFDLQYLHVACGTGTLPTASVRVKVKDVAESVTAAACGDGPIDAAYEAIRIATGKSPKVENFALKAITAGKDALGEATVKILDEQNRRFTGRGVSTDIIEASAKAYVDAINRMAAAKDEKEEAKIEL